MENLQPVILSFMYEASLGHQYNIITLEAIAKRRSIDLEVLKSHVQYANAVAGKGNEIFKRQEKPGKIMHDVRLGKETQYHFKTDNERLRELIEKIKTS